MTSIKKNISYQVFYQILKILLPLITSPYIARVLGANGVGIYSYTFSIAHYFAVFAKLGINMYGNRSIAMVRDDQEKLNQTFSDLLVVHLCVSAISLFAYGGYFMLVQPEYKAIAAIQALYVVAEMLDVNWLYFGLEQFKVTVTRNTIIKILTLISIFCFVKSTNDVWKYCAIMAVGSALSELIVWMFVPKYVKIVKPNWNNAIKHILPLISFFIPSVAVNVYKTMDKIMLGTISNTVQAGYYENSEKLLSVALGFITAVGTVMMPRMSNLASKGNEKRADQLIATTMNVMMISIIAMTGGLIGVSSVFAPLYWGKEFTVCDTLIMGLAFSMPFTAFANVLRTQFLLPRHHDKIFQFSVIAGACVNFISNFLLIPYLNAFGAVIGTILAEGTVCIIQSICASKYLPISNYIKRTIPYIIFASIMSIAVYAIGNIMGNSITTLAIQISVGAGIYIILTIIYLYVTKDALLTEIKKMLHKA